ncbi:hypothetical protein [Nocardioides caldifontis]|uniref:hypothetical protein n=1 Tax=Nocardioides caldifontis TaxID=2588938 RepID=UPI0011DF4A19|nr:hypothetical protein [Nocardioides caldifontis]
MAELHDESPGRALLVALLAMAGVALLVGLAIGGVVMGAVNVLGGGGGSGGGPAASDTLVMPEYSPTESAEEEPGLPGANESSGPDVTLPPDEPTANTEVITLSVSPQSVGPGEQITFNGVYVDGDGRTLQVQRKQDGAWTDFPVEATVTGGAFRTWIQTSQTGVSQFRVYDEEADRASNAVTVTIG